VILARWQIDARFGHKQKVIDSLKAWMEQFGSKVGWTADRVRFYTGSVGALECSVFSEVTLENLGELHEGFEKLATLEGHAKWSEDLEPHVVNGTHRWEVFRLL
jgi:hypothetical protein